MAVNHMNLVVIEGRLTADPEARGGGKVAAFSLASNRWFYKNDERIEETVYLDCSSFGFEAEFVLQKLQKGSRVIVEGRLELNRWETDTGEKRQKIQLVANRVHAPNLSNGNGTSPAAAEETTPEPEMAGVGATPTDDDIPF